MALNNDKEGERKHKVSNIFSELLNINIVNTCQRKTKIQMTFLKRQKQNVR
jgi:hypothetical protein